MTLDARCKQILQQALSRSDYSFMKFEGVVRSQFDTLYNYISRHESLFGRLRLSFFQGIIMMEWPTPVHEAPVTALTEFLIRQTSTIPFPRAALAILVHQNSPMKALETEDEYTPDTSLSFFSKDVFKKVKNILESFPEILVVLVLTISEHQCLHPMSGGAAWEFFRNHGGTMTLDTFLTGDGPEGSVGNPVRSGGHNWCCIENVDYHVWVRDGLSGPKINLDVTDRAHYVHGSLPSKMGMDHVETLLGQGFDLIKDSLIAFCQEHVNTSHISVDFDALRNHVVLILPLWCFFEDEFKGVVERTTHERYTTWYTKVFRGTKCPIEEEEHVPKEDTAGSSSAPPAGPGPSEQVEVGMKGLDANE
ncbi:hypothetical protein PAXINDRAFT_19800 [Paxillus involutus ATCC 200175]|uniref:Uncharacterized protein n=1 Tax=Paxillus involutus ATCC 200175 TaxID=664439 RepID=A0A0C9T6Y9_PAXIN|nr:hypothetical protein PAXINDRAFT_19800 [Paxillus involutus ATCC 200175]